MNAFTNHTILMLEDCGMSLGYPDIQHLHINGEGNFTRHTRSSLMTGRRVSIEQNQKSKFIIIFSLLDAYIDGKHPLLEGKSFRKKYDALPANNDNENILKEIFRIAKVFRNALVHKPSSYIESTKSIQVSYGFNGANYSLVISTAALKYFYTAIVMYIRGDLGYGAYFTAIVTSFYNGIVSGISKFSDDIGGVLYQPSGVLSINPHRRVVVMNPPYANEGTTIRMIFNKDQQAEKWEGLDFYITHNGSDLLIPEESLGADMSIDEAKAISNFKYIGNFPPILKFPQ